MSTPHRDCQACALGRGRHRRWCPHNPEPTAQGGSSPVSHTAETAHPRAVMREYEDGDERGWPDEFAHLLAVHGERLSDLLLDVQENGFLEPVLLGSDGRIWDGHHRLLVAVLLDMEVPVVDAPRDLVPTGLGRTDLSLPPGLAD